MRIHGSVVLPCIAVIWLLDRTYSLGYATGHGVLVKDTNYSPAGPQSLWTLADRHAFRRTLLEDAAAQPEQGSDKYGLKEAAIVVEASEEDEEDKEESEEAIKARKNSPPLLGSEINLKEEAEINGTDAFVEWAAQFGPNGTGFAGTNRVISREAARNRTWTESAMFDHAADLTGEVVMHEGFGGRYYARAFIATIPLGERRPFLAPGQVAPGPRVWEDSPVYNTTVDLSGKVPLREGFGGPYVALAKAYMDQLGERRPFLTPGAQVGDGWIINRGPGSEEGRNYSDSPVFDPEVELSGEIEVNEVKFGGPFIARAACGSTALGTRRKFQAPVFRGLKPRGDPFDLLGINEGFIPRPFKEDREANTTFNRVPDRPLPPPPPSRKFRKYVMPIPPSPPPVPSVPSPSERQKSKHAEGAFKYGPRLSQNWFFFHEKLAEEVVVADEKGGWDVLFLGDSLFEPWRGTKMDQPWTAYDDIPETWNQSFGKTFGEKAHVLAISGDGVKNIMWRLVNGEMPVYNMPKVLVVAAGTNDVVPPHGCSRGAAMTSAMKLEQMLLWIRSRAPLTYLIILGILPKGQKWPNACTEPIQVFNDRVRAFTNALFVPENGTSPPQPDDRLMFVDLSHSFLKKHRAPRIRRSTDPPDAPTEEWREELIWDLMPDYLHPSPQGMQIIAAHLLPLVEKCIRKHDDAEMKGTDSARAQPPPPDGRDPREVMLNANDF